MCKLRVLSVHLNVYLLHLAKMSIGTSKPHHQLDVAVLSRLQPDDPDLPQLARLSRTTRLRALKTNPEAFSSVYAIELQQKTSFWESRLLNPLGRLLVGLSTQLDGADPSELILTSDWTGILTLLGPVAVDPDTRDEATSWTKFRSGGKPETSSDLRDGVTALEYHLVAMWVAPEMRRKGVGSLLIKKALELVKEDLDSLSATKAIVTIGASDTAMAAQALCRSSGFRKVAVDMFQADDGRLFTDFIMRQDIVRES